MIKLLPILLISAMAGAGGFSAGVVSQSQVDTPEKLENVADIQIQAVASQYDSSDLFLSADGKYSLTFK